MSNGKAKAADGKNAAAGGKSPATPPPATRVNPPPLFRKIDWTAFAITTLLVFIGYCLTLAPDLTLEDSGELAVGSFYAGIPHPPGYPVWTILTWAFCHIFTVGNIAFRVAVASAIAGSLTCGLISLLVSRGSSMMIEGIADLKTLDRRWENLICLVSGFVAGMLLGFNGYMWSQSVIVEVYPLSALSFLGVLLCLLRWAYAPHQMRYLYLAFFIFGICVTNHQTLLLAAMGIEIAIAAIQPRIGRDLCLGNTIFYVLGLVLKSMHILTNFDGPHNTLFFVYNTIGFFSIAGLIWLTLQTREIGTKLHVAVIGLFVWLAGASFYLYMPLAGMSDPPMQWGYPRTAQGFWHALTRGQYAQTVPTDIVADPLKFIGQIGILLGGVTEEFNWVYALLALIPFVFFLRMQKRERAWLIGLTGIYACMGVLLCWLISPTADRATVELTRVQFTNSHIIVTILIGYGLTLIAAYLTTHYQKFRLFGLCGGGVAIVAAVYELTQTTQSFFGEHKEMGSFELFFYSLGRIFVKDQYALPLYAGLLLLGMAIAFVLFLVLSRNKPTIAATLAIFALMPAYPILNNWFDNEQHGHLFGYWFGHDMFTPPYKGSDGKPLYPEMARDAILFGGTDPGRFCPTYMIFDESFIPPSKKPLDPNFDRRDVYIITQNALADGTYLEYIRAHYNRSKQIDTPFFQDFVRSSQEQEQNYKTNALARAMRPLDTYFTALGARIECERRTSTSMFSGSDFTNLKDFAQKLTAKADPVSQFVYDSLTPDTQKLLGTPDNAALRPALAKDLNHLLRRGLEEKKQSETEPGKAPSHGPLYTPERFQNVKLLDTTRDFIAQDPESYTRIRLNRLLLEEAYPGDIAISKSGVYPDREIYIPTAEDSQECFQEYMSDASRRLQMNQLKPGEQVQVVNGKVQVTGQVAVMAINGLLTKVIFDHNPKNEFYVEESFPLDWMYPHLTPFGIIMKVNRDPVPELSEDTIRRDHEFWTQYSDRLIGNWVTYDTSVKEICDFVEKVYMQHDFSGFKGDLKFVRDDQAQKAFSKLRSSIASSVYGWRISHAKNAADQMRMVKEADFAYRQAFAFCPYSPEALFHYVQLLAQMQRIPDALLLAETALKLDPNNGQISDLITSLRNASNSRNPGPVTPASSLQELEQAYAANPSDFQAALNLAAGYMQLQQTNQATAVLRKALDDPHANASLAIVAAQAFAQMQNFDGLEVALQKLTQFSPSSPEAWYDLARIKIMRGHPPEALADLTKAIDLSNQRRLQNSTSVDLRIEAAKEPGFVPLRSNPEFQKLTAPPAGK